MLKQAFLKSIKNLRFSVFIPDIYLTFIELILAFLFLRFTGLATLINNPQFLASSIEEKLPTLGLFFSENVLTVLLYFTVFVFMSFILGSSLNAMRYSMIRDIVLNEQFSFRKVIHYGAKLFPIVLVRVMVFVSGVLAFMFISGSYTILKSYYSQSSTLFIVAVLGVAAVFFLKLVFMFTYALMFLEKKGAFSSVGSSFVYFLKNKAFVFKVFLLLLLVSLVLMPFEYAFIHYQQAFGMFSFYTIALLVLRGFAAAFYTVWSEVFVFYSYNLKVQSP